VNIKNIDPSEYEDDEDLAAKKLAEEKKQNAIVKAKPTTLSGWDPETKTQSILTDEQMQAGGGMGAMDLDDWRVTALEERDVGKTFDASHGARTVMKQLLVAGVGNANPHPPAQVAVTFCGRERDGGLLCDEVAEPTIFNLDGSAALLDNRWPVLAPPGLVKAVRTMRLGERARITILPEQGFGAEGDASRGVPPDAYLEYEVQLHRIIQVSKYDNGGIVMRHLSTAGSTERDLCRPAATTEERRGGGALGWPSHRGCGSRRSIPIDARSVPRVERRTVLAGRPHQAALLAPRPLGLS